MTEYDIKRLALIYAVQTEVMGMVAENSVRLMNNESLAYDGDAFLSKAQELENLAYKPSEHL